MSSAAITVSCERSVREGCAEEGQTLVEFLLWLAELHMSTCGFICLGFFSWNSCCKKPLRVGAV